MAVNITPLHDRVLVRRLEEKESVKGGIIIPDSAKEKPQEGEVIAVGSGRRRLGVLCRARFAGSRLRNESRGLRHASTPHRLIGREEHGADRIQ